MAKKGVEQLMEPRNAPLVGGCPGGRGATENISSYQKNVVIGDRLVILEELVPSWGDLKKGGKG